MKYLSWFGGVIVGLVAIIYVVAFTSFGNSIISAIIENKIKEQTKLDAKLSVFSLNMSEIEILLKLNTNNSIYLKGSYSPFSQSFDIDYNIKLHSLKTLQPLTNSFLNGDFKTDGNVKGDMSFMKIKGKSDIASSSTNYNVELTNLNPTSIIAKVQNLDLSELLMIGNQKAYANGEINLDVNFKSIKTHALDGDIKLSTKDTKINTKVMKKDFGIIIPKTAFSMNLNAKLKGDEVRYKYLLESNLFKIKSSGDVIPEPLKTNIKYSVDIKELALLKPITGADVRGSFKLNGKIKGTEEKLILSGKSDVALSDTSFNVVLKKFEPDSINASVDNLRLASLFYMTKQPHYADGVFSLHVEISNARTGKLKGKIISNIKNALVDSKYMTKAYAFKTKMPRTTFKLNTLTVLDKNILDTKVDLDSSLANIDVQKVRFNILDGSIKSDYVANIVNLDKLYFATNQHMRGSIKINGDFSKDKDLDLSIYIKIANGEIDATLHNDDFRADLKSVDTIGLLHMLKYPELFKAKLNARVDYNLADSIGIVDGDLLDGHFVKNKTFDSIKKYVNFNMYKENFHGDVSAKINKEKILASLDLKSKSSSIKTKDTKLNTKTQIINSKLKITANKNPIDLELSGDINQPNIKIDLEKFMKSKAGKKVKKELNRFFNKLF